MVTTLVLVRHGETNWNRDRRWQNRAGSLNDVGREQARTLVARLDGRFDAIYASDMERAHETAGIVAAALRLPVHLDERLREVERAGWEGLTGDEIDAQYDGAFSRWVACGRPLPEGLESDEQMADRVLQSLTEIALRHPGKRVLVVTSGGPIRAAEAHASGVDQAVARRSLRTIEDCGVLEIVVRDGALEVAGAGQHPKR